MISFIVIGFNEGWKLTKCLQSVFDTIEYNSIEKYEVIYVDSNSTDDSIKRAKNFSELRIYKLTGEVNAAIARNVGANEAFGEIFFFLDGDMEINKKVFKNLFVNQMHLKFDFISGDFKNIYYKDKGSIERLSEEMYHKNKSILVEYTSGGLFAIRKDAWFSVNGMRDVFKRSQDMDLGLRLSKNGIYLHRLPIHLANHHTVGYTSKNRIWEQLLDFTHLYGRSLLYRKNILNYNTSKLMIKQDYSLIILCLMILTSIIFKTPELILVYFLVIVIRSVFKKNIKYLGYFFLRDVLVIIGIFLFHPSSLERSYISVR